MNQIKHPKKDIEKPKGEATGYLTATDLGRYHVHFCKKFLWLVNDKRKVMATTGKAQKGKTSALDQARFDRGNKVTMTDKGSLPWCYYSHRTESFLTPAHLFSFRTQTVGNARP